ncbi:hypothetical protein V202x_30340 [Gimesia aquarii]|uniref:Uncharacterized protein n=2 Tax=Gimesia aquarii TaxID=2527964 RepID=A0A517WWP9_9PLAN|nr:hypothetical protein V202x_30340 [Gimesia aquarii]
MNRKERDEVIAKILSENSQIQFLEDVMIEYEKLTGEALRSFWPVYFVGKRMGQSLDRKPLEDVDDPVSLRELVVGMIMNLGNHTEVKKIVEKVSQENAEGKEYPLTIPRGKSFSSKDLAHMDAQELLNRVGSFEDANRIINQVANMN